MNHEWGDGMDNIYHIKCLQLILAIGKALDKMDAGDHDAAPTDPA